MIVIDHGRGFLAVRGIVGPMAIGRPQGSLDEVEVLVRDVDPAPSEHPTSDHGDMANHPFDLLHLAGGRYLLFPGADHPVTAATSSGPYKAVPAAFQGGLEVLDAERSEKEDVTPHDLPGLAFSPALI